MARLPQPGGDSGSWGDILNDFLSQAHTAYGLLKPGAVSADIIADDGVAEAKLSPSVRSKLNSPDAVTSVNSQTGAVVLNKGDIGLGNVDNTADSAKQLDGSQITSGTIDPTHLPAVNTTSRPVYPLSAYGFFTASIDLESSTGPSTINAAFFTRVFIPAGSAINAIAAVVTNSGTLGAGGLNSFAIYEDDGTFVASTVNDDSQWAIAGWVVKTFTSPIAAQSTDRFVYAALACSGYSSDPSILYNVTRWPITAGGGYLVSHRRSFYVGQSSWPASINPASYGNDGGGYIPLIALG